MSSIIPPSKPKLSHLGALNILGSHGVSTPVALLGLRGYYLDSMGRPGINDRRIYDDAIFLVGSQLFVPVNANTDPNGWRAGHGTSEATKGMASLKEGVWHFKRGIHKGLYPCFVQAEEFVVYRDADSLVPEKLIRVLDGVRVYEDKGEFGIHYHYSSDTSTSSLGCQTAPREQYITQRDIAFQAMSDHGMSSIPYLLTRL